MNSINHNYTPVTAERLQEFESHYSMYGSYAAIGEFVVSLDARKGAIACRRGVCNPATHYIFQGDVSFDISDADDTKLREAISMFNAFVHWLQQNKKVQIIQEKVEREFYVLSKGESESEEESESDDEDDESTVVKKEIPEESAELE